MNNFLLAVCTCLSNFIVATILFQFMNDSYNKTFHNKYVYCLAEAIVIIGITIVNLLGSTILNLVIWTIVVIMLSVVLYFNDYDNVLRSFLYNSNIRNSKKGG